MAVLQADRVKENKKLVWQIENLELLRYELQFQALECEIIMFSFQSQYPQGLLGPNIQDARNLSLLLSQIRLVINADGNARETGNMYYGIIL